MWWVLKGGETLSSYRQIPLTGQAGESFNKGDDMSFSKHHIAEPNKTDRVLYTIGVLTLLLSII